MNFQTSVKGRVFFSNIIAVDCVNPLFLWAILSTPARSRLQKRNGKPHVLSFPIIVPRSPVKTILEIRKTLLSGPVSAS